MANVPPQRTEEPISNITLERLFLQVRMGRTAQRMLEISFSKWPARGGILIFPTWVSSPSEHGTDSIHTWPIYPSIDPGLFVPPGAMTVDWAVRTTKDMGRGQSLLLIGNVKDIPQVKKPVFFNLDKRPLSTPPIWAAQLAQPIKIPTITKSIARQTLQRLVQQGEQAQHTILIQWKPLIIKGARSHYKRISATGPIYSYEDIIQQGWIRMLKAINVFSSNDRPHCSWVYHCRQEIYKDTQRTMTKLGGESVNIAYVRSWLWNHPEVQTLTQARAQGLSSKYSDTLIHRAIASRTGSVSLDNPIWRERTGGSDGLDRHKNLGYTVEELDADPLLSQRLKNLIIELGFTVEELEPWLYKIGALDYPHTNGEVYAKYGKKNKQIFSIEQRFFNKFAIGKESWQNVKDRPAIRQRAKRRLLGEDT